MGGWRSTEGLGVGEMEGWAELEGMEVKKGVLKVVSGML